jgi:hypothetical protein
MNQRNEETRSAHSGGFGSCQRDVRVVVGSHEEAAETDRSDVESTSLERLLHFSL